MYPAGEGRQEMEGDDHSEPQMDANIIKDRNGDL